MNEELKEKLDTQKFDLLDTTKDVEKIIDLIKDSNVLDLETRTKTTAFLEGYMIASKEQIEFLRWVVNS